MSVESASYISGLNILWPLDSDSKSEGDNHLRLIKSALKTSFPNVNGAVTVTDEELNTLSGVASNVQTQINDMSATISAMTTRMNNLSATLTTLTQSISALNTMATSRPVYGAAVYLSGSQNVLTAISATIVFNSKYYDVGSTFDSATGRITAPTGTVYGRFRMLVNAYCGTGVGGLTVKLNRGGSAMAAMTYSAVPMVGYGTTLQDCQFVYKTPFITAAAGETFCLTINNTTSATAVVTASGPTPSSFEAEFRTWS